MTSVNTNIAAMNAYRNLSTTNTAMNKSLERLSSGFRINRAADDAAGLAISEGLRSQIGGLTQAVRNTQDGTSVVQTAEGALSETTSILQRMRDLSVQASNSGSLNTTASGSIQKEITQLKSELDRISNNTTFNGTNLLDGSYNKVFQVGANAGQTIGVNIATSMSSTGLGVNTVDVTTGAAQWTLAPGAVNFAATSAPAITLNLKSAGAQALSLTGWDTTGTAAAAAKNQGILQKAFDGLTGTSGFKVTVGQYGDLTGSGPAGSVTGDLAIGGGGVTGTATFNATAGAGASAAINAIDAAITTVSGARADLGAIQNRFEHTINNLHTTIENTTASESRIRDTDMASEMTNFTRTQVLTQAGTAMLAQANQATQSILKLLG
jgi:flagellin